MSTINRLVEQAERLFPVNTYARSYGTPLLAMTGLRTGIRSSFLVFELGHSLRLMAA